MKSLLSALLSLRPVGSGMTPDAAFLLPASAMLSHDWLAPQIVLIHAQQARADGPAARRV